MFDIPHNNLTTQINNAIYDETDSRDVSINWIVNQILAKNPLFFDNEILYDALIRLSGTKGITDIIDDPVFAIISIEGKFPKLTVELKKLYEECQHSECQNSELNAANNQRLFKLFVVSKNAEKLDNFLKVIYMMHHGFNYMGDFTNEE